MLVVMVDDQEIIAHLVERILEEEPDLDYRRGSTDVTVLMDAAVWSDVDVALVDLLLPGTTGDTLLAWLATNAPHVRRIAMSGAGALRLEEAVDAEAALLKPFMLDQLLAAL